jgi:hypothetical protein
MASHMPPPINNVTFHRIFVKYWHIQTSCQQNQVDPPQNPPARRTDHTSHDEALNTRKSRNFPKATWRATSSCISHIPRLLNGNSTTTSRLPGTSQITTRPVHKNGFAVTVIPTAAATMDAQDKLALSRSSRSMTRRYNAFLYRASYRGDKGSASLETVMPEIGPP